MHFQTLAVDGTAVGQFQLSVPGHCRGNFLENTQKLSTNLKKQSSPGQGLAEICLLGLNKLPDTALRSLPQV